MTKENKGKEKETEIMIFNTHMQQIINILNT